MFPGRELPLNHKDDVRHSFQ